MKLNTFMSIAAIVSFIFGVGFIVAPSASLTLYGESTDIVGQFLGRYLGASLVGLAFVIWLTRNAAASPIRKGLLVGLFVTNVLGLVVAIYDMFSGTGNALSWLNIAIFLLLAIGFGYFAFMKTD